MLSLFGKRGQRLPVTAFRVCSSSSTPLRRWFLGEVSGARGGASAVKGRFGEPNAYGNVIYLTHGGGVHLPWSLVTTFSRPFSSASSGSAKKEKEDESSSNNIFLDNLGKIFLGLVGALVLFIYRSTVSNGRIEKLRDEIEDTSSLDPEEVNDLRFANKGFDCAMYNAIARDCYAYFGRDGSPQEVKYEDFVARVFSILLEMKQPNGAIPAIQFGNLLDRVVYNVNETGGLQNSAGGKERGFDRSVKVGGVGGGEVSVDKVDYEKGSSLFFLLVLLSLCIYETPDRRLESIFRLCELEERDGGDVSSDGVGGDVGSNGENNNPPLEERLVKLSTVEKLVTHLQTTCQLPPDQQILETEVQYPFREYKRATGSELVQESLVLLEWTGRDENITLDNFCTLLKSRGIGYCGECYKLRRKND